MSILVRLISALAELNPTPASVRLSFLTGEARARLITDEWSIQDAFKAVAEEFGEKFEIRHWIEGGYTTDSLVISVRERQ